MKKGIVCIALSLILFSFIDIYAQNNQNIPFPSLLTVKYQDGYIIINFEPLKDITYSYKIYRSTSAILKTTDLSDKNLIKIIKSSDLPFKDTPDKDGRYYYAVIATKNGEDFKRLIPLQNTLVYPIEFSPAPKLIKITKITNQNDDEINIYIEPTYKNWKYFLYINNDKLLNLNNLKPRQTIIGPNKTFNIKIKRGIGYYFAVTVQNRLGIKNEKLSPGKNVTTRPFKLEKFKQPVQVQKPTKKVEKKVKRIALKEQKAHKPSPKKKIKTKTLIDRTITLYFVKGKYKRTIKELKWILKTYPTTQKQKSIIYFYIGQSYFYVRNYKKSLKYFIICKDYPYYKRDANAWIDRILKNIN